MKKIFIVIFFIINLFYISYSQDYTGSFEFEGLERKYEVYQPSELKEDMPLIISLHGYSEDFKWYRDYTQLHLATDTAGYVLVCPQAINLTWNIGITEDPDKIRVFPKVNDVEFISTLIDTICNKYSIDMKRIYCCGFSTGGEMSLVLACCLGHRFAAVASVAGGLYDPAASWYPCKPMPVLEIHGTSESMFSPYDGRGSMWSVEKTLNYWLERNKITDPPDTIQIPNIITSDNCRVVKLSYTKGLNKSEVIHYRVIGGGHSWPGSKTTFGAEGNKNLDISANTEILKFFSKFENPYFNTANPKSFDISPKYIRPEGDSLTITANLVNPENHSVAVYGVITGGNKNFEDSLQLFDDGLHDDVNALDNIFGRSEWLTGLDEDFYKLKIRSTDLEDSLISYSHFNFTKYFTTIGPVVIDTFQIIDQSANFFKLKYDLRNDGLTAAATTITSELSTTDSTNVTNITGVLNFGNITPGQVKSTSSFFPHYIYTKNNPSSIYFTIHIFSNDHFFWKDSFTVDLTQVGIAEDESNLPTEYALKQNYPNPFNPTTSIKYSIPNRSKVIIKVYDVLGKEIKTLLNEEKSAGSYEINWNAADFPSGVYFYQLIAGDFISTKKMVLLK